MPISKTGYISLIDSMVQTALTVWVSYWLLVLVTTHYMAPHIAGIFVFLAIYQVIVAGIRIYWKRKTGFYPYLKLYFAGVLLVILLYALLIFVNRTAFLFTSVIILPLLLAIYLCVLSWLMSFARVAETPTPGKNDPANPPPIR